MISLFLNCVVVVSWIFALIILILLLIKGVLFLGESVDAKKPLYITLSYLWIFIVTSCALFICVLPKYLEQKEKAKENIPVESSNHTRK